MMKTRFLTLLVLTLMLTPLQSFAEEIEIKFGETVSYEDLNLTVYDVEDSRCPLDVTCVWEGKVSVRLHTSNQTHKMGGTLEIGFPFTYITPYTITLVDVKPHPISTEKPEYVAILEITKPMLDDEFADEQMCETGKTLVDGICQVVTDPTSSDFRESGSSVELVYVYSSLSLVGIIIGFFIIKKWRKNNECTSLR